MRKQTTILFIAGLFVFAITTGSFAEEMAGEGEMSAEKQVMMTQMEAYSAPNENHELLASLAGSWKATVEHKMSPDVPAETSEGISENDTIYGGRFLEQSFQGDWGGMPFEGKGLLGYDNIQKKFQTIWYDNIGTGIMTGDGIYDATAKTIIEEGQLSCPMTNDLRWYRAVTTLLDADHYKYETFMRDENGNEFQSVVIQYSRMN